MVMPGRNLPSRLQPDELVTAVQRVRDALAEETVEFWLQLRVTTSQFHALHTIRRHGRVSGRQLACALGVSPAAVVALCDRLEQQGYVARVREPSDRRVCWVELTCAGEEVFEGLVSIGRSHLAPALARLSSGDREFLTCGLNALAEALAAAPQPTSSAAPQFGHSSPGSTDTRVSHVGQSTSTATGAKSSPSASAAMASGTAPRSTAGEPQLRQR
jgi:DNA-binding MarR family transcriptional regulator